jgi:hypothetical protein
MSTDQLDQLELLSPQKIQILPFTKARSFDDDDTPDGVLVVLAATDIFGDHVKAVGDFRFELYEFRPASGDPKGRRLGFWEQPIRTVADHRRHWDAFTQTYEFELYWDTSLQTDERYVLQATYVGPDQRRLFDEYVFDFRTPRAARQESRSPTGQGT